MTSAYLKGCERVAHIVSKGPSFREIVRARVAQELDALAADDRIPAVYVRHLIRAMKHGRIYDVAHSDVCFFGKTENNLKEFMFLLRVLEEQGIAYSANQFLDFTSVKKWRLKFPSRVAREIIPDVEQWLKGVGSLDGAHLFQHLQYTSTYLNVLDSYRGKDNLLPLIAVVANDHSPSQVGFAMAMEHLGVPVIYIQHAEVSCSFPPLDFAASVLRNRVSLETYQAIGEIKGRVFIVSRDFNGAAFREVLKREHQKTIVGIYPTSRCDAATIRRAVDSIRENDRITDYFVKPHPNSATKFSKEDSVYFQIRTSVPEEDHVALVGNSSMVIELLSKGVPVYQLFDLDNVERDYYGFVRTGLAPETDVEGLKKAFWESGFYDDRWLEKAARYDPSLEKDQVMARAELAQFVQSLLTKRGVLGGQGRKGRSRSFKLSAKIRVKQVLETGVLFLARRSPRNAQRLGVLLTGSISNTSQAKLSATLLRSSTIQSVETIMDQVDDRAGLVDLMLRSKNKVDLRYGVMSWFDKRWRGRDARALDFVRSYVRQGVANADSWVRLKIHDIAAIPLESDVATSILEEIKAVREIQLRIQYEDLALRVFIKNGLLKQFFSLLHASPVNKLENLSSNYKVEIARLISRQDMEADGFTREEFLQELSAFERKKIYAAGVTQVITCEKWSHGQLEKDFVDLAHPSLAKVFRKFVLPVYDRLRPRMRYMDIRTDAGQADSLRLAILDALTSRRPFSFVRLGDGEAYLFGNEKFPFSDDDRAFRERHWWGTNISLEQRASLISRSVAAVATADIVGIPSIHRFFRDFSEHSYDLLASTANRGIVTSVLGAEDTISQDALLTEDRAHHIVMTPECLREYIRAAKRTIFISSVKAARTLEIAGDLGEIHVIEVPTHSKTRDNQLYTDRADVLPLVMDELERKLRGMVEPGDLVLVGAGIAGKSFVGIAKEKGAVALDLGGMVEVFSGIPNGPLF